MELNDQLKNSIVVGNFGLALQQFASVELDVSFSFRDFEFEF